MTFPVRPFWAPLTCLLFIVGCSSQSGTPLAPSSGYGAPNTSHAAKPEIHTVGRRPQTSCPSQYSECVQVSTESPVTQEWCVAYGSGCYYLAPGVWTWAPNVVTNKGKKTKKVAASFCPNPGNPSTLTISTDANAPSKVNAYVASFTACNSASTCVGPIEIGVTIVSDSSRTNVASEKRGDTVSPQDAEETAVDCSGGKFSVPKVKGSFTSSSYVGYPTNTDGNGEEARINSQLTPPAFTTSNKAYKALGVKAVLGAISVLFKGPPGFVTFGVNNGDVSHYEGPPNWLKSTCTSSTTYGEVLFSPPYDDDTPIRSQIALTAAWGFGFGATTVTGTSSPFDTTNAKEPMTFTNGEANWIVVYCT